MDQSTPAQRMLCGVLLMLGTWPVLGQVVPAEPAAHGQAAMGLQPTPPASRAAGIPDPPSPRLVPFEAVLNGANVGNWLLLHAPGGFYAAREALDAWRIKPPAEGSRRLVFQHENWYALSSIEGFSVTLNPASQAIELNFAASAFMPTEIREDGPEIPPVSPSEPAAFFNYDLTWSQTRLGGSATNQELGALTELGYTGRLGALTSSFLGRQVGGGGGGGGVQWRRLETTFSRDFPQRKLSMRVGDSTTRPGMSGRPIYFGGVQIGSNFGLAPGFATQPLPVFAGSASAPSTVELYINDALRQTRQVPAGAFTIENPLSISGDGRARMVVRDALGRETVITQSFFSHADLLEEHLSDWSLELGAVRERIGQANADYGERFASGLWRHGVNKRLTVEARGEWSRRTRGIGVGISQAMPWRSLGQAALAWSEQGQVGRGLQWSLGSEYRRARQTYTMQAQGATAGYRTVGMKDATEPVKWQLGLGFSHAHERLGTFGVGVAQLESRQQGRLGTYSLSYGTRIGGQASLSVVFTRVLGVSSTNLFSVSLLWPLERHINTAFQLTQRNGQTDVYASAYQGIRGETGTGWRVLGGTRNGQAMAEAGVHRQGQHSLVSADVSASANQQGIRLGARGGLVFMDRRLFATRYLQDSFALVDVPGYADVGVNFMGREKARTDGRGQALVAGLQAYTVNSIRLNAADLPLSAEIDSLERITVPFARSAVKLSFPVRGGQSALVTVQLAKGEPAPAGAEIERLGEDARRFPVGRKGQAFITGLQAQQPLRLHWKGASCLMQLTLPPGTPDDIARPPPLICEGVEP
ncbi:MAG: fimbria/pilus outer membrane usher protein [Hydrogenophaga sp.]|uniref:fimbria/pilus outer membrane usher protein n=1 Tax=Hydrogenophaga sp. TaxID=1904254 RepID=UPI003D0A2159